MDDHPQVVVLVVLLHLVEGELARHSGSGASGMVRREREGNETRDRRRGEERRAPSFVRCSPHLATPRHTLTFVGELQASCRSAAEEATLVARKVGGAVVVVVVVAVVGTIEAAASRAVGAVRRLAALVVNQAASVVNQAALVVNQAASVRHQAASVVNQAASVVNRTSPSSAVLGAQSHTSPRAVALVLQRVVAALARQRVAAALVLQRAAPALVRQRVAVLSERVVA